MKKSKIKLLTATACLALVGTASAAWVYAGTATESANIGVKVASYASAGEITINNADNVYVYLDKDSVTFKLKDDTKPFSATYTAPNGLSLSAGKKVALTYQVVIGDGLSDFIKFATTVSDATENEGTDTFTYETGWSRNWTTDTNVLEYSDFPALIWQDTYKGEALADETTYKQAIAGLTGNSTNDYSWFDENTEWDATEDLCITVTFKAEVVDE